MSTVGFVNICHEDYIDGDIAAAAEAAIALLREQGNTVIGSADPVSDSDGARAAARTAICTDADGMILFLGGWVECPACMTVVTEIMPMPLCLWGFGMFERDGKRISTGSYVSYAMFKGTLDRIGTRYYPLLAAASEPAAADGLRSFCRAAAAVKRLKRSRVSLVGYTSMSIYTGTFDHVLMRALIGPEICQSDSYSLIRAAESYSDAEVSDAVTRMCGGAKVKSDVKCESLERAARIYLAASALIARERFDAINIKCQYEFSKEYKAVPCVPLSALACEGVVASCEGDILNTVSMLMLKLLSGKTPAYGDAMDHNSRTVKLSSCGFLPYCYGEGVVGNFMPHPGFSGIQCSFTPRPGRYTVLRLVEDIGSYHFVYFTGEGERTPLRGDYMPALDIKPDGNTERLASLYSGQHYAFVPGDYTGEIEALARFLGIRAECV